MSTSTDAILVYGIPLKGEDYYWTSRQHFDEEGNPTDELSKLMYDGGSNVAEGDVYLEHHCSADYTMYIAAIKGTALRAWRGDPKLVDTSCLFEYSNALKEKLRIFMEQHNLEADGEIGWYLCSYWG